MLIAVCPNPFRDQELNITRRVCHMLQEAGHETAVCPFFAEEEPDVIPPDIQPVPLEQIADQCALAVVIGGDGTILSVVRRLHGRSLPVLGVNLGTKGFMTALEPEDLELVVKAAAGDYRISKRMMLDVSLWRGGAEIYTDHALNDVVLHGYGDCIQMTAWCDGDKITSF